MKNSLLNRINSAIILTAGFALLFSCTKDPEPSLYDPNFNDNPPPVITSVDPDPALGALGGVTHMTITGANFSAVAAENQVYFDGSPSEILEASTTQIKIIAPNVVKDSLKLRISVQGATSFSNIIYYSLRAAVAEYYEFQDFEQPYAITTDTTGNIYFSLVSDNSHLGIKRLTPEGLLEDFAPPKKSFYSDLKYGPDGKVYGTVSPPLRAVYANELGAASAMPVSNNQSKFVTLDFDSNNNIWVGGSGGEIYRITIAGDTKGFAYEPTVKSLRFFEGYLYAVALEDTVEKIVKFHVVSADELGAAEEIFNISENLGVYSVNAITFSADGRLFMGTTAELNDDNSILVLNNDGTATPWYPGLTSGPVISFAWDSGNNLYYTRQLVGEVQQQMIMKMDTEIPGAPYYGRD